MSDNDYIHLPARSYRSSAALRVADVPTLLLRAADDKRPPRWIITLEADIPSGSADRVWDDPASHVVLRFETGDRALVESLKPGDLFRLDLARVLA